MQKFILGLAALAMLALAATAAPAQSMVDQAVVVFAGCTKEAARNVQAGSEISQDEANKAWMVEREKGSCVHVPGGFAATVDEFLWTWVDERERRWFLYRLTPTNQEFDFDPVVIWFPG